MNYILDKDPFVGTLFDGRYLINFLVARGGMGNIYQAHDVRMGRIVALKMLRGEFNADALIIRRFLREAEVLSGLTHENICHIYESGCTPDGLYYFTMEYLQGHALDAVIAKNRVVAPAVAVQYMIQVASALCDAHNHGIIHRDLKPANIFIVQIPNTPEYVKVLDFGVAKIQNQSQEQLGKLTNAGSTLGTPYYMSPEQIQGSDVDGRTDIYALGVIFWECLFGKPPYVGTNLMDVFQAAVSQKLPKLPKNLRSSRTWRAIYALLRKSLQKNRAARYASMQEFLRALENLRAKMDQDKSMSADGAVSKTTSRILHAFDPRRMSNAVWGAIRHLTPLKLALIGGVTCLCLGSLVASIVFLIPADIDAPAMRYDTYKFFANPGASIFVGGRPVGATPLSMDLEDRPPFTILLKDAADDVFRFEAKTPCDGVCGYAVNFADALKDDGGAPPMLSLETVPPGASVFVNGKSYPVKTPCLIDMSGRLQFLVEIALPGYKNEKITVVPNARAMKIRTNLFRE